MKKMKKIILVSLLMFFVQFNVAWGNAFINANDIISQIKEVVSPPPPPPPSPGGGSSNPTPGGPTPGGGSSNTCVPNCSCADSISSASMCSDGCGGRCTGKCKDVYGSKTRIKTCTDSKTGLQTIEKEIKSCSKGLECPGKPTCVPDCSCALYTCAGDTCSGGCIGSGGSKDCPGELVDRSFSPPVTDFCLGTSFLQTGDFECKTKTAIGTKTCKSSYCDYSSAPLLYCSNNDVRAVYDFWVNQGCNVSTCLGDWSWNSCGDYKYDECGNDTCDTNGADHEYCKDGDVWAKYDGTSQGCAGESCYNNHVYCNHYEKDPCKVGYACKVIDNENAECVPKSATWTEI